MDLTADDIAIGIGRLLRERGYHSLVEFKLNTGRRADLLALNKRGRFALVEIKTSRADFLADDKWRSYLPFADRFYFAVPVSFPAEILPEDSGLIVADRYGGDVVREAPETPMHASARKALTVRFAMTAARRLTVHTDPAVRDGGLRTAGPVANRD